MNSHLTDDFRECFAQLPDRIQYLARKNYALWQETPAHPSLQFKRVGKHSPVYAVRIGIGWRALGRKVDNTIVWFWIGSHADYDRLVPDL